MGRAVIHAGEYGTYLRLCLILALSAALLTVAGFPSEAAAQPVTMDLTGEECLDGGTMWDPDGDGPLPAYPYCVMLGNLGSTVAIEIDDINDDPPMAGDPSTVADANLEAGADADNPDLPAVGGATYIDWDDLAITNLTGAGAAPLGSVEDHRILDWTANGDKTMFKPQARSCLNSGSVLPKEDFTQSYIASNNDYLYFGQERRTNNGNSVYYWLLTSKAPYLVANDDCDGSGDLSGGNRGQLTFDLSAGDVEILVNFPSSGDPAGGGVYFRVYSGADSGPVAAKEAVFHSGWGFGTTPVDRFALLLAEEFDGIDYSGDDAYPPWGGITKQGNPTDTGTYTTAGFAEWAVDLSGLFGGGGSCGNSIFITGMSRSSTGQDDALTEPSALKDLIGPKMYSFGDITASASLVGSCTESTTPPGLEFTFSASAVGIDGTTPIPAANLFCEWTCTTDPSSRTINSMAYDDATHCSGTGYVALDGRTPVEVDCSVTVTDTVLECSDDAEMDPVDVYAPLLVSIATTDAPMCTIPGTPSGSPGTIGAGVTYSATVSGGDGNYNYTWHVAGPNDPTCGDAASCTIDPPDNMYCARNTVYVTVDDGIALCPPDDSEEEVVTKQTVISATNN